MLRNLIIPALLIFAILGSSAPAFASGSYGGAPPHPPTDMDRELFQSGKQLFLGKAEIAAVAAEGSEQLPLMESWVEVLPAKATSRVDLISMAGKLDVEQLKALHYFLSTRFKMELPL